MMATVWRVERHRWLDLTARLLGGTALGPGAVFVVFAAVLLIIALNVIILGEETMGRSLDEISGGSKTPVGTGSTG